MAVNKEKILYRHRATFYIFIMGCMIFVLGLNSFMPGEDLP